MAINLRKIKTMDKRYREIGKLLWEKHLFELSGNSVAAEKIDEIIKKIKDNQEPKTTYEEVN